MRPLHLLAVTAVVLLLSGGSLAAAQVGISPATQDQVTAASTGGLDRSEHVEVGFDFSLALEAAAEARPSEPRPATRPPDGQERFTFIVEGLDPQNLIHAWSDLCQVGSRPPAPEVRAVYSFVTTVQGYPFRFGGRNPEEMRDHQQTLFKNRLGTPTVRTHLDN